MKIYTETKVFAGPRLADRTALVDKTADLKVLVVHDDANMRSTLTGMLRNLGVRHTREASDGLEALAVVREWPTDLAIVDLQMSGVDGVQFTRLARTAGDAIRYLPIVMLIAPADRHRVKAARDAGVSDLLAKPVTAAALGTRMERLLATSALRPSTDVSPADHDGGTDAR